MLLHKQLAPQNMMGLEEDLIPFWNGPFLGDMLHFQWGQSL